MGNRKKEDVLVEEKKPIYREGIILVFGIFIGLVVMSLFIPERIAKLENGEEVAVTVGDVNVTANELYDILKESNGIPALNDIIDLIVLQKKYPLDEEALKSINSTAEYHLALAETYYGYSQKEFLEHNGFATYDDFIETLKLEYLRNRCYEDYVKDKITDKEIKDYYNKNVYGDITAKHVLIEVTDNDDENAKLKLANEILAKVKKGMTLEEVKTKYGDKVIYEDLGTITFDNNLENAFVEGLHSLKDSTYSSTLVKTSYGYHIIYRGKQSAKEKLDDIKSRIIEVIASNKKENDETLYYKSLIAFRKDAGLNIKDTALKSAYNTYISNYK